MIPFYCPLCRTEAKALTRKGGTLTARFECTVCRLRFSIVKADLAVRADLIDAAVSVYG